MKQPAADQHDEIQVNFDDNLEVIREEQNSPLASIMENEEAGRQEKEKELSVPTIKCICANTKFEEREEKQLEPLELLHTWKEKEMELQEEFKKRLEKETTYLKDRFNFILQ